MFFSNKGGNFSVSTEHTLWLAICLLVCLSIHYLSIYVSSICLSHIYLPTYLPTCSFSYLNLVSQKKSSLVMERPWIFERAGFCPLLCTWEDNKNLHLCLLICKLGELILTVQGLRVKRDHVFGSDFITHTAAVKC